MKKYNIKKLISTDTVVNCKTKKQAKNFLEYLHSQGYAWDSGSRPLDRLSYFDSYLNETCFELTSYKTIMYSPVLYFKANGYKVLLLKDIKVKKEER